MALARMCPATGDVCSSAPAAGPCPNGCRRGRRARDAERRAAKPQRKVWNSARWQRTRRRVWRRDYYTCQRCGHRDFKNRGRTLVANHGPRYTLMQLLELGLSAFDLDYLETLCLTCSGTVDGARSRRAS